jgi:carboxymethylenebutenolidase
MDQMQYGLKEIDFQNPPEPESTGPRNGLSRRNFIVTSLASGFALASGAVEAQAINTDTKGLVAGEVNIPVADGKMVAYHAMPAKGKNFPVLLVIEEIFGVHEHIRDVCRRYAKLGYHAIAPELLARQGDVSKMTDIGEILSKVISKVPDAQVLSDLDATVAFAKASGHSDTGKLGIIGYCWGGRTVWLYAAHNPQVKAGVAYYGLLDGMKSDIKPQDPVDLGETIKVPVLGLYAGMDTFIKPEVIEKMRGELAKGSSGSEVIVFPGVNHGFNADYRPTYDKIAADYAYKLAREWLKEHGV